MSKQPTEVQRRWLGLFRRQPKGPPTPQDRAKARMKDLKSDLRKALKVRGYGEVVKQDFANVERALKEKRYNDALGLIDKLEQRVKTALASAVDAGWVEDKSGAELKDSRERAKLLDQLLHRAAAVKNQALLADLDLDAHKRDIIAKIGTDDPDTNDALADLRKEMEEAEALDAEGQRLASAVDRIYAKLQPVANPHLRPPHPEADRDRLKAVATAGGPDDVRDLDHDVGAFRSAVGDAVAVHRLLDGRLRSAKALSKAYTPKTRHYKKLRDAADQALKDKPRPDIEKAIKALEVRLQRKVGRKETAAQQPGGDGDQGVRDQQLAVGALVRIAGMAAKYNATIDPARVEEIQADLKAGKLDDAETKRHQLRRDIERQMPLGVVKKDKLARRRRRVAAFVTRAYASDDIGGKFTAAPLPGEDGAEDPAYGEYKTQLAAYDSDRSAENAVALAKAAQQYLAVHAAMQEPAKSQQKPLADHCQATLASLGPIGPLAEMETLGERDDLEAEMRQGALYAKLLLEANGAVLAPMPKKKKGVNSSQWIRQTATKKGDKNRFIYKDMDGEGYVKGFPRGGSAVREVLAKRVNDNLQQQLGIDFGVPETHLVGIDNAHLPPNKQHKDGSPVVGSMQHFAQHKGDPPLKSLPHKNVRALLKTLPKAECHKMILLDLVTLNTDRHNENLLVQGDGDDARLVPIDQGLAFPDKAGLKERSDRLGPAHAFFANPGCKEPFDPAMVARIKALDADAIVAEMTDSFATMKQMHPGAADDQFMPPECFTYVKRSVEFLKAVCDRLTVQQVMLCYYLKKDLIFTADDSWQNNIDRIVAEITREDEYDSYWDFFYRQAEKIPQATSTT
jgi:hypothetical protein